MLTSENCNQRRMMIITSDEKVIEQIRTTNNPSSFETFILEYDKNNYEKLYQNNQSMNFKRPRHMPLQCAICDSVALGRNFGVITCESCKIFFRRNALKNPRAFRCRHNNTCEITLTTRRHCSSCRLAKCFLYGMKRDRLLKAEEKAINRDRIKEEAPCTIKLNNTMHDQNVPWQLSTYPTEMHKYSTANSISEYATWFCSESTFHLSHIVLTVEESQRIKEIDMAFKKSIESDNLFTSQLPPYAYETSLSQHLNSYSVSAMQLLTFFKEISEFNELHVDDKLILTKCNLIFLLIFNVTFAFSIDAKQIRQEDYYLPWNSPISRATYGIDICFKTTKIFKSFLDIKLYDYKIIEMILIVLFLTKGLSIADKGPEPLLLNSMTVHYAQNYYTELLWKYIEVVHGFEKACRIFNQIVTQCLTWQTLGKQIRDKIEIYLSKIDEHELSPLMKSLLRFS